jgi:hypothetical protein
LPEAFVEPALELLLPPVPEEPDCPHAAESASTAIVRGTTSLLRARMTFDAPPSVSRGSAAVTRVWREDSRSSIEPSRCTQRNRVRGPAASVTEV